jgi:hypothetical protein
MPEQPKVLVTERGALDHDTVAVTPGALPNLCVVVITPLKRVLIRTARTYLQALLAFLTLAAVGAMPEPGADPTDPITLWGKFVLAAGYALAPALVALLQNLYEVGNDWDATRPELRG